MTLAQLIEELKRKAQIHGDDLVINLVADVNSMGDVTWAEVQEILVPGDGRLCIAYEGWDEG